MTARPGYVALVAALAVAGGCRKGPVDREVDHGLVRLATDKLALRHGTVGHDRWESEATYVLIDAHNQHGEDLMVTLTGSLISADGDPVGTLRAASLRVPAGGVRTFALVDREQQRRPGAVGARIEVAGAHVPGYAPTVLITDGAIHRDGDRVVVNGVVTNAADRPVKVIVIAGFHDADGVPRSRPFSLVELGGEKSRTVQFVGPPGSVSGYIFAGEQAY